VANDPESSPLLNIDAIEDETGTLLVVAGEIDLSTADLLGTAIGKASTGSAERRVRLDLRGVSFMDSTGVKVLVTSRSELAARLTISAASPTVVRLLEVAGLGEYFPIGDPPD